MKLTLKMLRSIVADKAAEMGWNPDDVLVLAAGAFARGNPIIDNEHLKALTKCETVTGRSVESLTDEALADFVECGVPNYMEAAADRSANA